MKRFKYKSFYLCLSDFSRGVQTPALASLTAYRALSSVIAVPWALETRPIGRKSYIQYFLETKLLLITGYRKLVPDRTLPHRTVPASPKPHFSVRVCSQNPPGTRGGRSTNKSTRGMANEVEAYGVQFIAVGHRDRAIVDYAMP